MLVAICGVLVAICGVLVTIRGVLVAMCGVLVTICGVLVTIRGVLVTIRGVLVAMCGVLVTICGVLVTTRGVLVTIRGVLVAMCGVLVTICGVLVAIRGVLVAMCGVLVAICGVLVAMCGVVKGNPPVQWTDLPAVGETHGAGEVLHDHILQRHTQSIGGQEVSGLPANGDQHRECALPSGVLQLGIQHNLRKGLHRPQDNGDPLQVVCLVGKPQLQLHNCAPEQQTGD